MTIRSIGSLAPLALPLTVLAACGLPPGAHTENDAKPLEVHPVEWNPTHANVGKAVAVADVDGDVVVAGAGGATILEGGAPLDVDSHAALTLLSVIPAPDGTGAWIAGVDTSGGLLRLRGRKAFEPVAKRYGLDALKVSGVAGSGDHLVAFELGGEVAVANGKDVRRFPAPSLEALLAGGDEVAGLTARGVWLFDAATNTPRSFDLPGARFVALDEKGHLFAATEEAVYADRGDGTLALRFRSKGDAIHGLVASGSRVWFADGSELGTIEGGDQVKLSRGARVPASARLTPSRSGDVWTIDADGALARWATGGAAGDSAAFWSSTAGPVYARACAACHDKGGLAGIDLSTEAKWRTEGDQIRARVIVARDMPPKGQPILSDGDREAILRFIDSTPATNGSPAHD